MALTLAGNSALKTPSRAARNMSVGGWVRFDNDGADRMITLTLPSGYMGVFHDGGFLYLGNYDCVMGAVVPGQWYYIGFTVDSSGATQMFIGSRLLGNTCCAWINTGSSLVIPNESGPIDITGMDPNNIGFGITLGVTGRMQHCTVWDGVINQATIEAAMNTSGGAPSGAWAHYALTSHTDITDSSGNGRHLTAYSGTTAPTTGANVADPPDPTTVALNIACCGNSLTQGDPYGGDPYPEALATLRPTDTVTNFGQASFTTDLCRGVLQTDVLPTFDPTIANVVLWQEYTNDDLHSFTGSQQIDRWTDYVAFAHARGFYVIASTGFPYKNLGTHGNETTRSTLNAAILAKTAIRNEWAIDSGNNPAWQDPDDTTDYTDGIHGTTAFYTAWAADWDTGLDAWLASLSGGSVTYTLTAAVRSYAVTGVAAGVQFSRALPAVSRSFAVTGRANAFTRGRVIGAAQGSYAVAGQAALLKRNRTLTAVKATYTLTLRTANFAKGRSFVAAPATYTLTGVAALPKFNRVLSAVKATYVRTYVAASLARPRIVTATSATYVLSGKASGLVAARKLTAAQATYAVTALPAALTFTHVGSYAMTCTARSYAVTAQAAALIATRQLPAAQATYAAVTQPASLLQGRKLAAAVSAFALTAQPVNLAKGQGFAASTATYTLTGQAASPRFNRRLTAAQASFSLTLRDATLTRLQPGAYQLTAAAASYAVTGVAAVPRWEHRLTSTVGSFALTLQPAILTRPRLVSVAAGSFVTAGQPATFSFVTIRHLVMPTVTAPFSLTGRAVGFTYSGFTSITPPQHRTHSGAGRVRVVIGRP